MKFVDGVIIRVEASDGGDDRQLQRNFPSGPDGGDGGDGGSIFLRAAPNTAVTVLPSGFAPSASAGAPAMYRAEAAPI